MFNPLKEIMIDCKRLFQSYIFCNFTAIRYSVTFVCALFLACGLVMLLELVLEQMGILPVCILVTGKSLDSRSSRIGEGHFTGSRRPVAADQQKQNPGISPEAGVYVLLLWFFVQLPRLRHQ